MVPIVQMGRLRSQKAPTQEAGSPFVPGGPRECGDVWTLQVDCDGDGASVGGHAQTPCLPPQCLCFSRTFTELKAVSVLVLGRSWCFGMEFLNSLRFGVWAAGENCSCFRARFRKGRLVKQWKHTWGFKSMTAAWYWASPLASGGSVSSSAQWDFQSWFSQMKRGLNGMAGSGRYAVCHKHGHR